eukprot:7378997-Prymnesium_polylepis.2
MLLVLVVIGAVNLYVTVSGCASNKWSAGSHWTRLLTHTGARSEAGVGRSSAWDAPIDDHPSCFISQ